MATEKQLKLTDYYYTKEYAETNNNKTEIWHTDANHTRYPTEKLVKDSLDGKVNIETGMGLSQNSFTDNEKSKLNDIAPKATAVSFTRNLNSGTKIGELKINDITTELFCNNDTNTLYYGDESTIIKDSNNKFSVNTIPISKVTNLENTLLDKANSSDIPTNTNQLTNGAGFITANDNSITKKLDKDDSTYQSLLSDFETYKGNLDTLTNEYNTHSHGNITREGTITSTTNNVSRVLVVDENDKIQTISTLPSNNITHQDISEKIDKTKVKTWKKYHIDSYCDFYVNESINMVNIRINGLNKYFSNNTPIPLAYNGNDYPETLGKYKPLQPVQLTTGNGIVYGYINSNGEIYAWSGETGTQTVTLTGTYPCQNN